MTGVIRPLNPDYDSPQSTLDKEEFLKISKNNIQLLLGARIDLGAKGKSGMVISGSSFKHSPIRYQRIDVFVSI